MNPKKFAKGVLSLIGAVIAGILIGQLFLALRSESRKAGHKAARELNTQARLTEMQTLSTGDTLTDHMFESLDGDSILLTSLLKPRTLLSVIQPGCGACLYELEGLKLISGDSADMAALLFISSSNPRLVKDIVIELGLSSPFLYDHKSSWLNQYHIEDFPFNIIVDSNLVIRSIFVGGFEDSEIRDLFRFNSVTKENAKYQEGR